jgi:hypothetical protein
MTLIKQTDACVKQEIKKGKKTSEEGKRKKERRQEKVDTIVV